MSGGRLTTTLDEAGVYRCRWLCVLMYTVAACVAVVSGVLDSLILVQIQKTPLTNGGDPVFLDQILCFEASSMNSMVRQTRIYRKVADVESKLGVRAAYMGCPLIVTKHFQLPRSWQERAESRALPIMLEVP